MNALKHGRRPARMGRIGMILASEPTVRDALLAIADRWERNQMKADEVVTPVLPRVERQADWLDPRARVFAALTGKSMRHVFKTLKMQNELNPSTNHTASRAGPQLPAEHPNGPRNEGRPPRAGGVRANRQPVERPSPASRIMAAA